MAWLILGLKILGVAAAVVLGLFVITFTIYFFNLDMKLMASLIKPLTFWYDWSKKRRETKKAKLKAKNEAAEAKKAAEKNGENS